jgi:hypothetical protein
MVIDKISVELYFIPLFIFVIPSARWVEQDIVTRFLSGLKLLYQNTVHGGNVI